ncbi:MAG TPA: AbrB/MazE/SpoVT family DNA-binding domain-containing protein [Candidatus Paceibacterota bacterium]
MKIQERPRMFVKLGSNRQIVIPKKICDELGLKPGDYLSVEIQGKNIVYTPLLLIPKNYGR